MHYLKEELDNFLCKIAETQFRLYQVTTYLENYRKVQREVWKDSDKSTVTMATALIIGDLNGPSINGWKINYPTGFHLETKLADQDSSFDEIISREGMRSMATCYEIFESFLFDITGQYLNHHRELAPIGRINQNTGIKRTIGDNEDAKTFLRENCRSANNKELFKLIHKYAPTFLATNSDNNEGVDLKGWYEVLSKVRHAVVHQLFKLNFSKDKFSQEGKLILKRYFTYMQAEEVAELQMTKMEANHQIGLIAEYGFLIFKSFCIEEGLEWKVLIHME